MKNKIIQHVRKQVGLLDRHKVGYQDLLRALDAYIDDIDQPDSDWITVRSYDKTLTRAKIATIPLNYRTIEDIPEDDPCWEQLCKVFNLV